MLRMIVVGAALFVFIGEGPWNFDSKQPEQLEDSGQSANLPAHLKLANDLRQQIPATGELIHSAQALEDRALEEFEYLKVNASDTWDRIENGRRKTSVPGAEPAPLPLVPPAPNPLVPRVARVPTDPLPY
jgi:hypothetical protein